jgi:hypothetical protein
VKYELGEEKEFDGIKMRLIVALVAIASKGVSVGDVGGWVQSEANLSQVSDEAWVSDEAQVFGEAQVSGKAWVSGKARVTQTRDLLVIGPIGSRNAHVTFASDYVATGCFCGTFDQFAAAVTKEHRDSVHASEYMAALEFARVRFPKKEGAQ